MGKKRKRREITHWDCGDFPDIEIKIKETLRNFIDDNVYEALEEYGKDISLFIGENRGEGQGVYYPDIVVLYLGVGRPGPAGAAASSIKTELSLRDEIMSEIDPLHRADDAIQMAGHLESIAALIRRRILEVNAVEAEEKSDE